LLTNEEVRDEEKKSISTAQYHVGENAVSRALARFVDGIGDSMDVPFPRRRWLL
jgi:hypothetical protein